MRHGRLFVAVLMGSAVLGGCATHSLSQAPELPEMPERWGYAQESVSPDEVTAQWWNAFGNDELTRLVQLAQVQSLDLAAAASRVRQAQAGARIAGAALSPQVIGEVEGRNAGRLGTGADSADRYGGVLTASYELDFWGRLQAAADGARAELQATRFDYDTVRLTVTAAVAASWLAAVSLNERIEIGQRSLHTAERLLELVDSQVRAGAATPLELEQQRNLVAGVRRNLASLRQQAEQAMVSTGLLLGQTRQLRIRTDSLSNIRVPNVNAGLPSELLLRRPDIAYAEQQLAVANAQVRVARAAMFPRISLSASASTGGAHLDRALSDPVYALAANLIAPIFNAGGLAAEHELALEEKQELVTVYRKAIVQAANDVQAALVAVEGAENQRVAQAQELASAERVMQLAESRYRAGAETLLTLLDAQRTLYAAQDRSVQIKYAQLQAAVSLYKSLGGGWVKQLNL